jgi:hypothetical protein
MGYLSYGEMCSLVNEWEYRIPTAERRLRGLCADKSEAGVKQIPEIAAIKKIGKRKGGEYIAGWEWIAAPKEIEMPPVFKELKELIDNFPPPFKTAPKETKNQTLGI